MSPASICPFFILVLSLGLIWTMSFVSPTEDRTSLVLRTKGRVVLDFIGLVRSSWFQINWYALEISLCSSCSVCGLFNTIPRLFFLKNVVTIYLFLNN